LHAHCIYIAKSVDVRAHRKLIERPNVKGLAVCERDKSGLDVFCDRDSADADPVDLKSIRGDSSGIPRTLTLTLAISNAQHPLLVWKDADMSIKTKLFDNLFDYFIIYTVIHAHASERIHV